MDDDFKLTKKIKDYSEQTKQEIKKTEDLLNESKENLNKAIEGLLGLEKQARIAEDNESTSKLIIQIVKLCAENSNWDLLNENLLSISKKRQQSKMAIQKMVQEAMKYIDNISERDVKVKLIETLQQITEGKIFVEIERARLAKVLAKIYESEGDNVKACKLLQDIQIETIGTMEAPEKIEFILEIIRLCLDTQDDVRAQIVSKKITKRSLDDIKHQELKINFYRLMIRYYTNKKSFIDICKCYREIYSTPIISNDKNLWKSELESLILFLILSPFDNEQFDFINRMNQDKNLEEIPLLKHLIKIFISLELINWKEFQSQFIPVLSNNHVFKNDNSRLEDLHTRIVEHNIRVISTYYSTITMKRLSQLIGLEMEKTEDFISKMVINHTIVAKINRIENIVKFSNIKEQKDILNNWSSDINELLSKLDKSIHLINKEYAQHTIITKE
jgi:26S proteasome regulatory subunit N5